MRKFFVMMYALVCMTFAAGCATTAISPPKEEVKTVEVKSNLGLALEGGVVTAIYTSVLYQEDAFIIEQFVLCNDAHTLVLHLFNPGGSAFIMFDVVSMLERLMKRGVKVVTIARGTIASAAVPIFVTAHERYIVDGAFVMIHPGGWKGYESVIPPNLLRVFEEIEITYATIVSSRTKISYEQMLVMLNHKCTEKDEYERCLDSNSGQHWFNSKEALELEIATGLYDNQYLLGDEYEIIERLHKKALQEG
jgi:ATP-dependent protease ClpP protease subunit